MSGLRFAVFLTTVLGIWALMHVYVFWRAASVPWIAAHLSRRTIIAIAIALWLSYIIARVLDSQGLQAVAWPLEYVAANWIGALFLFFVGLLLFDLVTLGGLLVRDTGPKLRGWVLMVVAVLASIALVQGVRRPVVTEYEIQLSGLPAERDGLVLVQVSDLHLGNLLGQRWLQGLISQINQLKPDIITVVGDLVDGNVGRVETLVPTLKELRAPMGVWAVTGNHEFYAGAERSVKLLQDAGFRVLRNEFAEAVPGVVIAGVDDLTVRDQADQSGDLLPLALRGRPPGATVFLSHTPWQADRAAALGANLMLSGHTHNGQIWPFTYLVRTRYPLVAGRYEVDGMAVIVCRGTGTWGPRMRLWLPGEIVRITLRSR